MQHSNVPKRGRPRKKRQSDCDKLWVVVTAHGGSAPMMWLRASNHMMWLLRQGRFANMVVAPAAAKSVRNQP